MSSYTWFKNLEAVFPEYQVEDYSGNVFTIVKNFKNKEGKDVAVFIYDLAVYVYKNPDGEGFLSLEKFNELVQAGNFLDDGNYGDEEYTPLIQVDERYNFERFDEEQYIYPEMGKIFDPETVAFLTNMQKEFILGNEKARKGEVKMLYVKKVGKLFSGTWLDRAGTSINYHLDNEETGLRINIHTWTDTKEVVVKLIEGDGTTIHFKKHYETSLNNPSEKELREAMEYILNNF